MSKLSIEYLRSDKDTHFTGALAQNAIEVESINFPSIWRTAGVNECIIEGLSIQSDQNLEWDVYIFTSSEFDNTDLDLDVMIDMFNFPTTAGKTIAGANQYYYPFPANNISIPYSDAENTGKLHVGLVNRSATGKNAGATGEIVIRFALRPIYGG